MISYERDIRPWVTHRRWLRRVRNYKSPVACEGRSYELYVEGDPKAKRLKGVTSLLRDYLVSPELRKPSKIQKHVASLARQAAQVHMPTRRTKQDRLSGYARGSRIHRQLQDYVMLDEAHFRRVHPEGMHPMATALLQAFLGIDWRPFAAEFLVHDARLRAGTCIDELLVAKDGTIIFTEVKSGYDGIFETDETQFWRPGSPFAGRRWPCTPKNRAIVQLMLGVVWAAQNLALPQDAYRAVVVHVDGVRGVRFYEVEKAFILAEAPRLLAFLRTARAAERKKPIVDEIDSSEG